MRFEVWLQKADLTIKNLSIDSGDDMVAKVLASLLPPLDTSMISIGVKGMADILDVLLVWHSLLLNSVDYQKYCQIHRLSKVYRVDFSWATLVSF